MASLFGGGNAAGSSSKPNVADVQQQKDLFKQSVQQQFAQANAKMLFDKMNENCFEKCVPKPGASLSSSEESCLSRCMALYSAAFDQVSQKYSARIFKDRTSLEAQAAGAEGLGAGSGLS